MITNSLNVVLEDQSIVDEVRSLSLIDNWKSASAILVQWITIAVMVIFTLTFDYWWVKLIAIVVIAAKQHALGVIVHDATHYRVFTSRFINEIACNIFCAFPIFMSVQGYRDDHQEHHRCTNTHDDPYFRMFDTDLAWQWPKTRSAALRQLITDVSGLNSIRFIKLLRRWSPTGQYFKYYKNEVLRYRVTIDLICSILFWGTIVTTLTLLGIWKYFLLFWVIPSLTFYVVFVRLRWISEHPYDTFINVSFQTRHVQSNYFERYFIAPLNVNYHIAHHLFPSVPLYNLPAVHQRLLRSPDYYLYSLYYRSYLGSSNSIRSELVK